MMAGDDIGEQGKRKGWVAWLWDGPRIFFMFDIRIMMWKTGEDAFLFSLTVLVNFLLVSFLYQVVIHLFTARTHAV